MRALLRSAFQLLASATLAGIPIGCEPGEDANEEVARSASAIGAADAELQFLRHAYATYVAGASDAQFAPLRSVEGGAPGGVKSSYYRVTCSLALVGALLTRTRGDAASVRPPPIVTRWIDAAVADYRNFALPEWGHHVRLAPAVDCLLAASVAEPYISDDTRRSLRDAVAHVATSVPTPTHFRDVGKKNPGNSQAEEAALAADFLYLASALAVAERDPRRARWRERAEALFAYAGSIPLAGAETRHEGEPFRRVGSTGQPLGADAAVVTNHGLETSPYYSLGALISYADAVAVARATGEALPPGITLEHRWLEAEDGQPGCEQLSVREIVSGGLRRIERTTFGFKGAYRYVGETGEANVALDYGSQTHTIPFFPPNSEQLIPTRGVGTVSQFRDPLDDSVKGYQIDGGQIRAFRCAAEPRWTCRASYKLALAQSWTPETIGEWQRFGGRGLPTTAVDAMPQWIDPSGTLHTEVFSGGRVWHYACAGSSLPRRCTAVDSVDLATHYARSGFRPAAMPPIDRIDAASAFVHVDGTGRRYWTRGDRVWRARCSASFTDCSVSSDTLAGQFGSLAFSPRLPTDRIDALTQFVHEGVLSTYVFRDDRVWKYNCSASACTPQLTRTIAEQWRGVTNQERWADRSLSVLRGVTDWGVQATILNATFALARVLGADDGAYAALLDRQVSGLSLASRTLFPSTFDPATGAFDYGPFRGAYPAGRHGTIHHLQDGWHPTHLGPAERLNTFTWLNAFAARNHAIAYMLTSGTKLPRPL